MFLKRNPFSALPLVPGLPDVASRPARRSFLESQRQGEVGSLGDGAKSGVSMRVSYNSLELY